MKELYINDFLCDLPEDADIALTLQTNDFENPDSFQANYTNQFKLPKSSINKKIFEQADVIVSSTNKPYEKMKAKYVVNGVEIVKYGKAILDEVTDTYNVTIYSAGFTFFDDIKNLSIKDLDLSDLDHDWNLNNIVATCVGDTAESIPPCEYVYGLIDWSTDTYWINNSNRIIDVRGLFPCVYAKRLLEQIFIDQGYTLDLGIIDSEPFLSEVIPTVSTNGGDSSNLLSFARVGITITYNNPFFNIIKYDNYVYDPSFRFSLDTPTGTIGNGTVYNIGVKGTYKFYFSIYYIKSGSVTQNFWVRAFKNDTSTPITSLLTITDISGIASIETSDVSCNKGDKIFVCIIATYTIWVKITGGGFYCTKADVDEIIFGGEWDIALNLPDISQLDFLKTICFQYNCILDIDTLDKTVVVKNLDTIYKNRVLSRDWSKKLDLTDDAKIEYRIGGYVQNNYFKYTDDSSVQENLGNGVLVIQDETLDKEKDICELPFAASEMVERCVGQDVAIIERCEGGVYDKNSFEPRILLISARQDASTFSYTDGSTTLTYTNKYHAFTTFIRAEDTYSLGFQESLLPLFYEKLQIILTQAKKVTAKFNLKMVDVVDFDHFKPVFVDKFKSMFYVNKIKNFTLKKSCEVELIKL